MQGLRNTREHNESGLEASAILHHVVRDRRGQVGARTRESTSYLSGKYKHMNGPEPELGKRTISGPYCVHQHSAIWILTSSTTTIITTPTKASSRPCSQRRPPCNRTTSTSNRVLNPYLFSPRPVRRRARSRQTPRSHPCRICKASLP